MKMDGMDNKSYDRAEADKLKAEALRYLGFGKTPADERTLQVLEDCIQELERTVRPGFLMREFPVSVTERVSCACFETESKSLIRNLRGCRAVIVMAATLGAEADRLLYKYERLSMSRAVILQAAAAAMIEAYCNQLCGRWKTEYEKQSLYLRPRFSPGYGDFPLAAQAGILNVLEAGKRLGLTLTEGGLMVPAKSVTAVIGVSETQEFCKVEGCEACQKTDCAYRR